MKLDSTTRMAGLVFNVLAIVVVVLVIWAVVSIVS
jgi:hypothetical protein